MNLNQPSLVQFEAERKANEYIPPLGSNSFYNIGTGRINILTKRDDPNDYRFDLFTDAGTIFTGAGGFSIAGDIRNTSLPYENLTIIADTTLTVNHILTISKGNLDVHGTLSLQSNCQLVIRNGAHVTFYSDSTFDIQENGKIILDEGCSLSIYGRINIHMNSVNSLIDLPGIMIDSSAVMNVVGLDSLGDRLYGIIDYYTELGNRVINKNTQGEKNTATGRLGYIWVDGDPLHQSQLIQISTLYGESVLGDFKLSILGHPESEIPNFQIVTDLVIEEDAALYVAESFYDHQYIRPELYIGRIIDNSGSPGVCVVNGSIIVDGPRSSINLDRGGSLHIEDTGTVYLRNKSVIKSTYNEQTEVLFINGTLIIDDISQIGSFSKENIVFGDNGKLIILNPDTGEKRLLWTTPNGIEDTELYRLFKDRIDHIEYHISNNTGIGIDKYYEFYAKDFTSWYGGRRIEKAIHDGIIVWHDGGFIELYNNIIPWVEPGCTLLHASRLFKTFGSFDNEKLQEAVDRLKYAGCGNIIFRFIKGDEVGEVTMVLDDIHMENIYNHPLTSTYRLRADNDGELFIKNNLAQVYPENIIVKDARVISVINHEAEFPL